MALYSYATFTLRNPSGDPEQVFGSRVTPEFFSTLATPAARGRFLQPADFEATSPAVVVLSHSFWRYFFAGDPEAVGRTISLGGEPFQVVGVMPYQIFPLQARHSGTIQSSPQARHLWIPLKQLSSENSHVYGVIARLKDPVTVAGAQTEMETIAARLAREFPAGNQDYTSLVVPLREELVGEIEGPLYLLLAAGVVVLLIAVFNVSNLVLVRSRIHFQEMAVRTALGAGRSHLFRYYLMEGGVLSCRPGWGWA